MNRIIILIPLAVVLFPGHAAANIGVSISPTSWNLGTFGANYYVQSPAITVTNTGNCYEVITATGNNSIPTGGDDAWTLTSGTPGNKTFKLTIYNPTSGWQTLSVADFTLVTWLLDATSTTTYVRFYGPSTCATNCNNQQTIQVVFKASAESGYTYNQAGDFYWKNIASIPAPASSWWTSPYESVLPTAYWTAMPAATSKGWVMHDYTVSRTFSGWGWYVGVGNCTPQATSGVGNCPLCGAALASKAPGSCGSGGSITAVAATQNSKILSVYYVADLAIDSNLGTTAYSWHNFTYSLSDTASLLYSYNTGDTAGFVYCTACSIGSTIGGAWGGKVASPYSTGKAATSNTNASNIAEIVILN